MELELILAVVGTMLFVLGLLSNVIKRLFLSSVLLALMLGVGVGPHGLGLIDPGRFPPDESRLLEEFARLTLAVSLMGAGLQISRSDLRENLKRSVVLLAAGMVGMWLLTALGAWLLLGLPIWVALLLGAILTPTDPVVASSLVIGDLAKDNLPRDVRRSLQIEAGANDGLALPFVLLAVFMLVEPPGDALTSWAAEAARGVGIAVAVGLPLGWLCGKLVELAVHRWQVEITSLFTLGLALAGLTLGIVSMLGGSGVLGVFLAAVAFSVVLEEKIRDELERVQEAVAHFLVLPIFTFFGAGLPWSEWRGFGMAGVGFALWVLLLRRVPVVWPALRAAGTDARRTAFFAWFGPVGVAAIYYATFVERFPIEEGAQIYAATALAVCASIVAHSLTATPGIRWFGGRSAFGTLRHPLDRHAEEAGKRGGRRGFSCLVTTPCPNPRFKAAVPGIILCCENTGEDCRRGRRIRQEGRPARIQQARGIRAGRCLVPYPRARLEGCQRLRPVAGDIRL
ncbi:MAG TPA: sodium:proton antiporter [Actinomycetota bacterium]|nr:sodium:proton antiporter [Actinomycetota bacterium]